MPFRLENRAGAAMRAHHGGQCRPKSVHDLAQVETWNRPEQTDQQMKMVRHDDEARNRRDTRHLEMESADNR